MTEASDGFVRLPYTVIEHAPLNAHELLVYMVLLKYRDHRTGKCWPGITTIADESRLSRRTVMRTISDLENLGAIEVRRTRNVGEKNEPNVYTVRVFDEKHKTWWHRSAKGTRIPKRPRGGSDSESLSREVDAEGSDSQSLGSDSQSLGVVTPSHPNKLHENKLHELAITPTLTRGDERFILDTEQKSTSKQLTLLHDLWIHATGNVPERSVVAKWQAMTINQARDHIKSYYAACGKYDGYTGPESGTPAYEALSPQGQRWADAYLIPDLLEIAA